MRQTKQIQILNPTLKAMVLVRYNPWQELKLQQRQLNRLFDSAIMPSSLFEKATTRVPAEIQETEDAIYTEARNAWNRSKRLGYPSYRRHRFY